MTEQLKIRAGIRSFNRGDYWKAHEHWEGVWIRLQNPEKRWLQGLIQAAAVFHLIELERYGAAQRLATSALEKLEGWPKRRRPGSTPGSTFGSAGVSPLPIRVPGLKALLRQVTRSLGGEMAVKKAPALLKKGKKLRAAD